jgi:hypothetical protein
VHFANFGNPFILRRQRLYRNVRAAQLSSAKGKVVRSALRLPFSSTLLKKFHYVHSALFTLITAKGSIIYSPFYRFRTPLKLPTPLVRTQATSDHCLMDEVISQ